MPPLPPLRRLLPLTPAKSADTFLAFQSHPLFRGASLVVGSAVRFGHAAEIFQRQAEVLEHFFEGNPPAAVLV